MSRRSGSWLALGETSPAFADAPYAMNCVIMQPTYLPWLGYFDLMAQADVFVILDHVQFSRRSWQQRNRIKTPTGLAWLTVPVESKGRFAQTIDEVRIKDPKFAAHHLETIRLNYSRAANFRTYFPAFEAELLAASGPGMLAALNIALLAWFARQFGIATAMQRSSELAVSGKRTDMLVDICRQLGAESYLSPIGSLDYLRHEPQTFEAAGLQLRFQNFEHPTYQQLHGDFEPYASAVDALLNVGKEAKDLIDGGRRSPLTLEEALEAHPAAAAADHEERSATIGGHA